MNGSIVHVAGYSVTMNARYLRQRCAWCGAVLIDYDLSRVGVQCTCNWSPEKLGPDGPVPHKEDCPASRPIGTWPVGALVRVDGGVQSIVEPEGEDKPLVPEDACASLDPAATA